MAPATAEAVERELETEEEKQEDDPELRDEVRHLGGLDEAEHLRLVRAEQQTGEQVCRNGGQAEAARQEPEAAEDGDGDGELAERQAESSLFGRGCLERADDPAVEANELPKGAGRGVGDRVLERARDRQPCVRWARTIAWGSASGSTRPEGQSPAPPSRRSPPRR